MTTGKVILISALTSLGIAAIIGVGFIGLSIWGGHTTGKPAFVPPQPGDVQIQPNK